MSRQEQLRRAYIKCMRSFNAISAWKAFDKLYPSEEEHLTCIQEFEKRKGTKVDIK